MNITKEKFEELTNKANKWDQLGKEIHTFYFDEDGNEQPDDYGDGLIGIGEVAAMAYGWL